MSEDGAEAALSAPATAQPGDARLELARILTDAYKDQLSGTLFVTGDPGGSFHLQGGAVVEVASPGAPGVATLLLRSGRVSEAAWASVVQSGTTACRFGVELVDRELVGAAELRLLCRMTALDGALATGMGRIDGFAFDRDSCAHRLASPEGIDPDWLLQETERRIRVLNSREWSISPFGDRLVRTAAGAVALRGLGAGERREILLVADGRRSSRDISFLLGRSLYAVAVELSRMLSEGLVEVASSPVDGPGVHPAAPKGRRRPAATEAAPYSDDAPGLPHRRPGASGINEILPLRPAVGRPPPALLAKFRSGDGRR